MTALEKLKEKYGNGEFFCLALVKPNSQLAREWKLGRPSYCIFEYDPLFFMVEIRWGDGSWQKLEDAEQLDDLILLTQFTRSDIEKILN